MLRRPRMQANYSSYNLSRLFTVSVGKIFIIQITSLPNGASQLESHDILIYAHQTVLQNLYYDTENDIILQC